jgi:NADH:ubiquinone oxidoreductase subunit 6 (subunit J)
VIAGAVVELTLFALAQIDISRREPDEIRGSKLMWRLISLVSFIGPILYFTVGRITPEHDSETVEATPIVA